MRAWTDWLDARPASHRAPTLIVLALFAVLCVAAAALTVPAAVPFVGAVAGAVLFLVGYGWWATLLTGPAHDLLNLKNRYTVAQRRVGVVAGVLIWFTMLLLVGRMLPGPLAGTLNVVVLCVLGLAWRPTPAEQAEAVAAWEAAQAEAAAEAAVEGGEA